MSNETLADVKDPISKAKLQGQQEASFVIDNTIIAAKKSIDEKRGVIAALAMVTQRLPLECGPNTKAFEEGKMSNEEAKARNDQIMKLVAIVDSMRKENEKDLVMLQGQIVGLEKASKGVEKIFNETAAKYDRWARIQEEEAAAAEKEEIPAESDETAQETKDSAKSDKGPKGKDKTKKKRNKKG